MTDKQRLDYLEAQCAGRNVIASRSRVNGAFRLSACLGTVKGVAGVRKAIDRAIEREARKEAGMKR